MKYMLLLSFTWVFVLFGYFQKYEILNNSENDFSFEVIEKNIDYTGDISILNFYYRVDNHYHLDIRDMTLTIELFLYGTSIHTINYVISENVSHHRWREEYMSLPDQNLEVHDFTITHVAVNHKTFIDSYYTEIFFALFFNFLLLLGWFIFEKMRDLYLSESLQIFKSYWWIMLIVVVGLPVIITTLNHLGRFELLTSHYIWIFNFSVILFFPLFFGIWLIYHKLKSNRL